MGMHNKSSATYFYRTENSALLNVFAAKSEYLKKKKKNNNLYGSFWIVIDEGQWTSVF